MSQPKRPDATESPVREHDYRNSPSRRRQPQDEEAAYYSNNAPLSPSGHERGPSKTSFAETLAPSLNSIPTTEPLHPKHRTTTPAVGDMQRKRSLIRPERNRIDRDHPNYHYRQHAANMNVLPSSTGNDPIMEDLEVDVTATETSGLRSSQEAESDVSPPPRKHRRGHGAGPEDQISTEKAGLATRHRTRLTREKTRKMTKEEKERQKQLDAVKPPSLWNVYCAIVTFWCPDFILKCFGKPAKAQQRAWREKWVLSASFSLL